MSHYQNFLIKVHTLYDLNMASSLLKNDKDTIMPKKGAHDRINAMVTLKEFHYELMNSSEFVDLLHQAEEEVKTLSDGQHEKSLVRMMKKEYQRNLKIPKKLQLEIAKFSNEAHSAWEQARKNDSFDEFYPYLDQSTNYCLQIADLYGYEETPYDALLDTYEENMKTACVKTILDDVKGFTVDILQKIKEKPINKHSFLFRHFSIEKQKLFCKYIASAIGFDFEAGDLGEVTHPYCLKLTRNDVRIHTRYDAKFLNSGLFATLHEAGHGIYEQNINPQLTRTPIAKGASQGIHESQSRLFENQIGRSISFWQKHYPVLQSMFFDSLKDVSLDEFYLAINHVAPSFIRVEADEITYNLHIILRFEIETELMNKQYKAKDVPEVWRQKMKNLLGIEPPSHALGCLQDVHWSRPGFGYFPTYTLGNLYAAQFMHHALNSSSKCKEDFSHGEIASIREWLNTNLHIHGSIYCPEDLSKKVIGENLQTKYFKNYIQTKYQEIYRF